MHSKQLHLRTHQVRCSEWVPWEGVDSGHLSICEPGKNQKQVTCDDYQGKQRQGGFFLNSPDLSGRWLVVSLNDLDNLILAMTGPSWPASRPPKERG